MTKEEFLANQELAKLLKEKRELSRELRLAYSDQSNKNKEIRKKKNKTAKKSKRKNRRK